MKTRISLYEIEIDGRQYWCRFKRDVQELKRRLKSEGKPLVTLIESDHRRMGQYLAGGYNNRMLVCSEEITGSSAERRKLFGHNCPFPQAQD